MTATIPQSNPTLNQLRNQVFELDVYEQFCAAAEQFDCTEPTFLALVDRVLEPVIEAPSFQPALHGAQLKVLNVLGTERYMTNLVPAVKSVEDGRISTLEPIGLLISTGSITVSYTTGRIDATVRERRIERTELNDVLHQQAVADRFTLDS